MTNKTTMSVERSQNKVSIKKRKLTKVSENVGFIAELKERAILKFSNENITLSCQYDEMFSSFDFYKTGKCYAFLY